ASLAVAVEQVADLETASCGARERRYGMLEADARGRADGRVLLAHELERLDRPGHQLGVEADPVRPELLPEPGPFDGAPDGGEQGLFEARLEEAPASPRVARADTFVGHPEAAAGNRLV